MESNIGQNCFRVIVTEKSASQTRQGTQPIPPNQPTGYIFFFEFYLSKSPTSTRPPMNTGVEIGDEAVTSVRKADPGSINPPYQNLGRMCERLPAAGQICAEARFQVGYWVSGSCSVHL